MHDDNIVYCVCFGCPDNFYTDSGKVPAFCDKCGCRIATVNSDYLSCLRDEANPAAGSIYKGVNAEDGGGPVFNGDLIRYNAEDNTMTILPDSQPQVSQPQAPQACNYCSCTVGVRLVPNPYEMRVKNIEIFEYLCWNCESKLNLQAKREGW